MNEIVNTDYANWLQSISKRYRQSQIKAAVAVNAEMLKFYFGLGADIVRMEKDQPWGSGFLKRLSLDLKMQMPEAECFSVTNLNYVRYFYTLYSRIAILPQAGEELDSPIFHVPWGHHKYIIDKLRKYPDKMTSPASRRSSPKSRGT